MPRPSMRCMICGLTAYARDPEMDKYGKSHYDCECGGHSFYPRAVNQRLVFTQVPDTVETVKKSEDQPE